MTQTTKKNAPAAGTGRGGANDQRAAGVFASHFTRNRHEVQSTAEGEAGFDLKQIDEPIRLSLPAWPCLEYFADEQIQKHRGLANAHDSRAELWTDVSKAARRANFYGPDHPCTRAAIEYIEQLIAESFFTESEKASIVPLLEGRL